MHTAIVKLPSNQLAALQAPYAAATRARRISTMVAIIAVLLAVWITGHMAEVTPAKFFENAYKFPSYIVRIFHLDDGRVVFADPGEWYWGWLKWLTRLGDTLLIAYLGTILGAIGAFLLCFTASANLTTGTAQQFVARRILEFLRTVPELVFALLFVVAFGLGPMPGVLALFLHTMGALGKLFSEVVENIDMKPVDGAMSTGATRWQAIIFAVLPQVSTNFLSYTLLRFEFNVRGASVMGFVGAGGIGQELIEAIRKFYYSDVSAILLLIIACVMVIDMLTEHVRHRLLLTGRKT